jgi:hypothetical protein
LKEGTISHITRISFKYLLRIKLIEDNSLAQQDFRFILAKSDKDITEDFSR